MKISFKFKLWLSEACEVGDNAFYSETSGATRPFRKKSEGLIVLNFKKVLLEFAAFSVVF